MNANNDQPGFGVDVRMTMLPRKLQAAGYVSYQYAKWHCGLSSTDRIPLSRGFSKSFGFLGGGEDHNTQVAGPMCHGQKTVDLWQDLSPALGRNGTYSAYLYTQQAVRDIMQHNSSVPMFMYFAAQEVHAPYQSPQRFLNLYDNSCSWCKDETKTVMAMVSAADESLANITAALKAKGLWANTLLLFSGEWKQSPGPVQCVLLTC